MLVAGLIASVALPGASTKAAEVDPKVLKMLDSKLSAICSNFPGRMGFCLTIPRTGQQIEFNGHERFPTASTIKTGVMVAAVQMVDEGKLKWTDKLKVPDKGRREASMWSFYFPEGMQLDLDGWVNLMVTVSDNTATIATRDWLGTMNINARLEALGLKNTKILGNAPQSETMIWRLRRMFGMGMTTPVEMNRLLQLIYERKAASVAGCEKMVRILSHQYWDDAIGASVPPGVVCASKSGAINRSRSDTAIVFSPREVYILTLYTDNQKDQRWVSDNKGDVTLRQCAGIVWNTLNPKNRYSPPPGYEKYLPTGGGIE